MLLNYQVTDITETKKIKLSALHKFPKVAFRYSRKLSVEIMID